MESINSNELNFSKSALNHFNDALMQRGKGNGVKLGIKKAGCSGYEYTFEYVDNFDETLINVNANSDLNIYVDSDSMPFLKGCLIDYIEDGLNKGIKFINPNAKAVCGCGESFTL
jgi:iron-sulfur cluster assembly protein